MNRKTRGDDSGGKGDGYGDDVERDNGDVDDAEQGIGIIMI